MAKYVYICSAGHSGSTLLDLLLGSHSRLASLGEISHLSKNIALNTQCTCGVPVRSCRVWKDVLHVMGNRLGIDPFTNPYALKLGYPRATVVIDKKYQTTAYILKRLLLRRLRYLELYLGAPFVRSLLQPINVCLENLFLLNDVIRERLNVDMTVNSSKDYLEAIGLYLKQPNNVRIILLTRDGRGVFYSNLKRNIPRKRSLSIWRNYYSRGQPLIERYVNQEHLLHVKYEDLTTDPRSELERISAFLDLEFEGQMLNYAEQTHHVTDGNNMRFKGESNIKPDVVWQKKLSPMEQKYFEQYAGGLNRELGYE